ncbi:CDP-alcohol phosphatidyltransferase family protein [Jonesia quinghaiensis]|uniref:CDP-alcohol phosphatidyltransferase family protein n=1 Tax=Jonesia quinghaiensis TaxID=262806 RepID=UPI0004125B85|nr:CDP-alcohol phosphatidyltransferase family protein [Jonesia quinghaiensis]
MSDINQARATVWTIPNVISFIRLGLIPVFAVLMLSGQHVWALVVVVVSSFSDWADGYIARRFHQVSELGKTLDPIADRCFIFVTLLVFVIRDIIPWELFAVIAVRDIMMLVLVSAIARRGHEPMAVTFIGKAATLFLLLAFPIYIVSVITAFPDGVREVAIAMAWLFAILGAVLYWLSALQYLQRGQKLLKQGPAAL